MRSTGFGVVEVKGTRMCALDYGNVPNAAKLPVSGCLAAIHAKLTELIAAWNPDALSVEKVIYGKNANTMMVLGEARGAVIVAGTAAGKPIYEYEPRRVKMAVCGNGLAEKGQVQRMMKTLLALPALPQNDAADALALAVCHAHANSLLVSSGANLV